MFIQIFHMVSKQKMYGNIFLLNMFAIADIHKWKVIWYRMLDSYEKPDREDLLGIERRIFENIKEEVEEETGEWLGTKGQNSLADIKVATSIFRSLKAYEDGRKRVGSFFNFKKLKSSQVQ